MEGGLGETIINPGSCRVALWWERCSFYLLILKARVSCREGWGRDRGAWWAAVHRVAESDS